MFPRHLSIFRMLPSMSAATAGQGLRSDQADLQGKEAASQLHQASLDPSGVRGLKKTEM